MTIGEAIGRYVVLSRLGAGGMGVVYAAHDPSIDRRIALKVLLPERESNRRHRARLLREARAIAKVRHPNVVTVHDVGEHGGGVFVAMELVTGTELGQWLAEKHRRWQEVLKVFIAAGRGLMAVHAAGLVHRDFKPANVMIAEDGRVVVMDFGLARLVEDPSERFQPTDGPPDLELRPEDPGREQSVTQRGRLVGTPAYMAPEQHARALVDAKSDQFSFCVALHEALFGVHPFIGQSAGALGAVADVQSRPDARAIPTRIRSAVLRGLSREPEERWPNLEALLEVLSFDPREHRRRWWPVAAGLACVGGCFALAAAWPSASDRCELGRSIVQASWDAEDAKSVEQAFLGTELPYAGASFEQVDRSLTRFLDEWAQVHRDSCRATFLLGTQSEALFDRRMQCLYEPQRCKPRQGRGGLTSAYAA